MTAVLGWSAVAGVVLALGTALFFGQERRASGCASTRVAARLGERGPGGRRPRRPRASIGSGARSTARRGGGRLRRVGGSPGGGARRVSAGRRDRRPGAVVFRNVHGLRPSRRTPRRRPRRAGRRRAPRVGLSRRVRPAHRGPVRAAAAHDRRRVSASRRTGHRLGALGLVDDITERRRLEAVRTDFVANISHELKTPVGALPARRDAGRRGRPGVAPAAGRAARARGAPCRSHDRRPARAEPHRGREDARARGRAPCTSSCRGRRPRAPRRRAARASRRGRRARRRLAVVGDRRQLVSAIGNLLDNAFKYSDAGRDVAVSSPHRRPLGRHRGRRTTASASPSATSSASSSASTGSTGPAAARPAAPASAWPSSATSPATTAARCEVQSHEGEGSTFTLRLRAGPGPVGVTTTAEAG